MDYNSNAIVECGAKLVFVDIGDDYNINANLIESKITKKTSNSSNALGRSFM